MKNVGKIGSVLAAFENNIAKNNEYQNNHNDGSISFISKASSTTGTSKRSGLKQWNAATSSMETKYDTESLLMPYGSNHSDIGSLQSNEPVRNSTHRDTSNNGCTVQMISPTTATTTDDDTSSILQQQQQQPTSSKSHNVRKIKIIRPANHNDMNDSNHSTILLDPATRASIKLLVGKSNYNKKLNEYFDKSSLSNQQTSKNISINEMMKNGKVVDTKTKTIHRTPLDRISATIQRVNSSNSLRQAMAAHAASSSSLSITGISTKSNKSISSKSITSTNTTRKYRKKLTDHIMDTTSSSSSSRKKGYDKSITSLPITTVISTTQQQHHHQSFSSLPTFLKSSSDEPSSQHTEKRSNDIIVAKHNIDTKQCSCNLPSIDSTSYDFGLTKQSSSTTLESIQGPGTSALIDCFEKTYNILEPLQSDDDNDDFVVTTTTCPKPTHQTASTLSPVRTADTTDISTRMLSPTDSTHDTDEKDDVECTHQPTNLVEMSSTKVKGIASAARRSSIEFCCLESSDMIHHASRIPSMVDKVNFFMPDSPQSGMGYDEQQPSESSVLTPKVKGIARAARRSSIEFCGGREFHDEALKKLKITTIVEGEHATLHDGPQLDMEYEEQTSKRQGSVRRPKSIARAARRSSIEYCSGPGDTDETFSESGISAISDEFSMGNTTFVSSEISVQNEPREIDCTTDDDPVNGGLKSEQQLARKLQKLNENEVENSENGDSEMGQTEVLSSNSASRRRPLAAFDSTMSIFTLDMNRCRKLPKGQSSIHSDDEYSVGCITTAKPMVFLPKRDQVVGILRIKPMIRNTFRHVKFADQQPGGGQRMNIDTFSKNDSKPIRPRRSINFDRTVDIQNAEISSIPVDSITYLSGLASTTIQAVVRRWIQWKKTRVILLTKKLERIEENRKIDLLKIKNEKWVTMENIQAEIIERERRLESQVSLGEKLSDHLKRDSSLVRDQTKKLSEYLQILKKNNDHLENSIRLHRENFATANNTVELLREKSENLLSSSKKYASRIDKLQNRLDSTSKDVQFVFHDKVRLRTTIKRIHRLLRRRLPSSDPLFRTISQITKGDGISCDLNSINRSMSNDSTITGESVMHGFDLLLNPHDNDMMSVFSDITIVSKKSKFVAKERRDPNESASSILMEISAHPVEHHYGRGSQNKKNENEDSFASYVDINPTASSTSKTFTPDPKSIQGNSFASYGVEKNNSFAEYTPKNQDIGVVFPPRRRLSYRRENSAELITGDFDAIEEEMYASSDESTSV